MSKCCCRPELQALLAGVRQATQHTGGQAGPGGCVYLRTGAQSTNRFPQGTSPDPSALCHSRLKAQSSPQPLYVTVKDNWLHQLP